MKRLIATLALISVLTGCGSSPRGIDWQWGPVLPEARSARATAAAGGRVITVGGTSWLDMDGGAKKKRWHRSVYALPAADDTWRALPDYPLEAGYAAAFGIDELLFVIGGRDAGKVHRETFILDLAEPDAQWKPGPPLPGPRFGLVGGVIGCTIYVTGGFEPDGSGGNRPGTRLLALDCSMPDGAWRQAATLPRADLEWPMAATCGGRLYVFGGSAAGVPLTSAWVLDPDKATWRTCRPMPVALSSGAATATSNRHVLICGGSTLAVAADAAPDGKPRTPIASTCLLYDSKRDRYRHLTSLPQAVLDQGLVVLDGTVTSIGGEESPHRTRTDLVQVGRLR
jgi:hypothetical protein